MTKQEQFFYDHAGWSYDPKTETPEQGRERCAKDLGITYMTTFAFSSKILARGAFCT